MYTFSIIYLFTYNTYSILFVFVELSNGEKYYHRTAETVTLLHGSHVYVLCVVILLLLQRNNIIGYTITSRNSAENKREFYNIKIYYIIIYTAHFRLTTLVTYYFAEKEFQNIYFATNRKPIDLTRKYIIIKTMRLIILPDYRPMVNNEGWHGTESTPCQICLHNCLYFIFLPRLYRLNFLLFPP